MKTPGRGGAEERNKMIAVAAFVAIAGAVLYYELAGSGLFGGSTPAVAVSAPQGSAGFAVTPVAGGSNAVAGGPKAVEMSSAVRSSAGLDPTLHMEAMLVSESVEYSGSGRNIFSAASAPVIVIPKPLTTARVIPVAPLPCPPNCPPPPPPPPIDLKLFAVYSMANGTRRACLLHDDNVILASAGDVVARRYRVLSVNAKSVQVEDMQNSNKQTLPLLAN